MSLVSMVDTKLARQQANDRSVTSPSQPVGVATNIVNQVTRWIPTETITLYVALLALLVPVSHTTAFTSRWVLFGIVTGANPVVLILLTMAKSRTQKVPFKMPAFEMVISAIAFAAWAFALPDTPLKSISTYDIKWNSAILSVTTVAITLIANALGQSPDFDQVVTVPQGATPGPGPVH
jgi:hypothetical protein